MPFNITDQVNNFVIGTVSTVYTNVSTSIILSAGWISRFPDPSGANYNVTWWDSTNYPNPSLDPNREIVRVTGRNVGTNTLTVVRGQEGTSASNKNTVGAVYKMSLAITKKTIEDLNDAIEAVEGSVTALDTRLDTAEADILTRSSKIGIEAKNGVDVIPTGFLTGISQAPITGNIIGYKISSYTDGAPDTGLSGSIAIKVYKNGSLVGTATLTTATTVTDTVLTGWTLPVTRYDNFTFEVDTVTDVTNFVLSIIIL